MRKLIIYILIFVLLCFFIPVVFTRKQGIRTTAEVKDTNIISEEKQKYKYNNYGTVKLLHNATGEVQEINMDEYLYRSCCCRDACKL